MKSKKPKPTSGYVSFIFKDMPSWKVNKLFVNNQEEKDFDFKDELHSIEHALAEINAGSEGLVTISVLKMNFTNFE